MDLTQRPSGTWIIDYGVTLPQRTQRSMRRFSSTHSRTSSRNETDHEPRSTSGGSTSSGPRGNARRTCSASPFPLHDPRLQASVFVWLAAPTLPDSATFAFARADDLFFGVLHSRIHEVWARMQGTQVRERECGFRYTPTTCFETFPFPFPDDLQPPQPVPFEPPPYGSRARREDAHPSISAPRAPHSALDHRASHRRRRERARTISASAGLIRRNGRSSASLNFPAQQTACGRATSIHPPSVR